MKNNNTKNHILHSIIGFSIGIGLMIILKFYYSQSVGLADIIPYLGIVIYFVYYNYKIVKKEKEMNKQRILSINQNQTFSYDNLLISKSANENDVIIVRNELFWLEQYKDKQDADGILITSLINDFTKLSESDKIFEKIFSGKIIEFSLYDNVNFEDRLLNQKKIKFEEINMI